MTPEINVKDLMNPLAKIKLLKEEKRQIENKKLLRIKLPVFSIGSYIVRGVSRCHHISCITPEHVWVNGGKVLSWRTRRKLSLLNGYRYRFYLYMNHVWDCTR